MDAVTNVPAPLNEPVRQYAPGSHERAVLEAKVKELAGERAELTMTVGGQQRMGGGDRVDVVEPHNHRHVLGQLGNATDADMAAAIESAAEAAPAWRELSFDDRAAIFLKAAELLAGPWRQVINAATILGQSKSVYQAEIDAACELIDFWRYNVHFARRLLAEQPDSSPGEWNRLEYRPLEGFVLAISPFNFTSIAANLPTAPALLGNVVIWKPSPTQQLSAHYTMRLLAAAGLPPGVINLVTGDGQAVSRVALPHADRDVPAPVADRRREHLRLPRLPAAGGGDRRQGLRDRAPVGGPGRAVYGAGPGGVRVPGPEMLRRVACVPAALGLGPAAGRLPGPGGVPYRRGRLGRPVAVHGRGH
jgi:1-pyrroline-5-carboxylate dehydrogenase